MSEYVAIFGSRGWSDGDAVRAAVESLPPDAVVVTGGWCDHAANAAPTRGVDRLAYQWAMARGRTCIVVVGPASLRDRAGVYRNPTIVDLAHRGICFWDGTSPGTRRTIKLFRDASKPLDLRAALLVAERKPPVGS